MPAVFSYAELDKTPQLGGAKYNDVRGGLSYRPQKRKKLQARGSSPKARTPKAKGNSRQQTPKTAPRGAKNALRNESSNQHAQRRVLPLTILRPEDAKELEINDWRQHPPPHWLA